MAASIRVTLYDSPGGTPVGPVTSDTSRNDLRKGYQSVCESVYEANSYSWSLAFTPDSTGPIAASSNDFEGTPSTAALLPPEGSTARTCKFNTDWDGSYLLRLVTDAGLPGEATTFVRLRVMTRFGDIKLIAAGERRDQNGVIPVDTSPEGWANDQNQNMQRVLGLVRRLSTSGRTLYVDANRGRDLSEDPNDPENIVRMPGPDSAARDESGFRIRAEGFGDFSSINDAIAYAETATSRGEAALSETNPYWIRVAPGYYEEALILKSHVHVVADLGMGADGSYGETNPFLKSVRVRVPSGSTQGMHLYQGGMTAPTDPEEFCVLGGVVLENAEASSDPCLYMGNGSVCFCSSSALRLGTQGTGVVIDPLNGGSLITVQNSNITAPDASASSWALTMGAGSSLWAQDTVLYGGSGIQITDENAVVVGDHLKVIAEHASGYALSGMGTEFVISYSFLEGTTRFVVPSATTENFRAVLICSILGADLEVIGTNTTGTVSMNLGATVVVGGVTPIGSNVLIEGNLGVGKNILSPSSISPDESPYAVLFQDEVVGCDTSANVISVLLPTNPTPGRTIIVKDMGGQAAVNNITVDAGSTGNVFDGSLGGAATFTHSVAYGSYTFWYYNGVWYAI